MMWILERSIKMPNQNKSVDLHLLLLPGSS